MSFFRGEAVGVFELASDLTATGARAVAPLRAVMAEQGREFALKWRQNAEQTSGRHGRYYPRSIDSELVLDFGGVSVDVGPNRSKRQGGMGRGFEYGSQNQPAHLDGLRAMGLVGVTAEHAVADAVQAVIP